MVSILKISNLLNRNLLDISSKLSLIDFRRSQSPAWKVNSGDIDEK